MIGRREFIGWLMSAGAAVGLVKATPADATALNGMVSVPFPAFPEYAVEINTAALRRHYPQMDEAALGRIVEDVFCTVRDNLAQLKEGDAFVHNPQFITVRRVTGGRI